VPDVNGEVLKFGGIADLNDDIPLKVNKFIMLAGV